MERVTSSMLLYARRDVCARVHGVHTFTGKWSLFRDTRPELRSTHSFNGNFSVHLKYC